MLYKGLLNFLDVIIKINNKIINIAFNRKTLLLHVTSKHH